MTGATLGSLQLGSTPLGSIPAAPPIPYNPAWANVNVIIQTVKVDS